MAGRRRAPSLDGLFVAAFALLGLRLGAVPIGDNSALWHIRTGIDIAAGGGIPAVDPYSWTAAGERWVVQSWLVEAAYGLAHRLGGGGGVVVLNAVLFAAVGGLVALLARTGRPVRTLAAAGIAVALGAPYWSPRPLMLGLLLLGLTVLAVGRGGPWGRWAPCLLIPIGWVWVNSHGSFVLGLGWLGLVAVGTLLDGADGVRSRGGPSFREVVRAAAGLAAGIGLGVLNPVGWRLVAFPFAVLDRREAFGAVVEWQSPAFAGRVGLLLAAAVAGAVVVLARARPRLGWADLVPAVAFLAAGLVAQRNLPAAAVVLAPVLGRALRPPGAGAPVHGDTPTAAADPVDGGGRQARLHWTLAAAMAALGALFLVGGARGPWVDLEGYPVAATRWLERQGLQGPGVRLVHDDVVGGWLIFRAGRDAAVFVDDRVDMYPEAVLADFRRLRRAEPGALAVLRQRQADAVLWETDAPLAALLDAAPSWRRAHTAGGYAVWLPSP